MALTTHQVTSSNGYWALELLYEELLAESDIYAAIGLQDRYPYERRISGTLTFSVITQASDPANMFQQVNTVLANHVGTPGPGPVGLSSGEIATAWHEMGKEYAKRELGLFHVDVPTFEGYDIDNVPQAIINAELAKGIYGLIRAARQVPPPANYDPFNEGTPTVDTNGVISWRLT